MTKLLFVLKCGKCGLSINENPDIKLGSCDGQNGMLFMCWDCVDVEMKERNKVRLENAPIERDLIERGYGAKEYFEIIPCIEADGIPEAVEFDTPGTNYWDLVKGGLVIKTFRTSLEDAFAAYLKLC